MKRIATAIAVTMSLAAGAASAGTVDVLKQHHSNIFKDADGKNSWAVATKLTIGNYNTGWVGAGAFRLKDGSGSISDFIAFCLEPLSPMITPTTYKMGSLFDAEVNEDLQVLAGNAMDLVSNKITAAALQLAAWEITTETADAYALDSGHFSVNTNYKKSAKAEALAETWLSNIQNDVWTAPQKDYLILNAEGTQDLLTSIQPMPLPASSLMLLTGLLGGGAYMRRKQKAK